MSFQRLARGCQHLCHTCPGAPLTRRTVKQEDKTSPFSADELAKAHALAFILLLFSLGKMMHDLCLNKRLGRRIEHQILPSIQ